MNNRIETEHINAISQVLKFIPGNFAAKRGKLNANEIIIGAGSDVKGSVTVKLAEDGSGRPTWFVGNFPTVTPKEISEEYEIGMPVSLESAHHWADMLKLVTRIVTSH